MPTKPKKSGRGEVDAFQSLMGDREMPGVGEVELIAFSKTSPNAVSSIKDLTSHSYRPRNSLMSQPLCNLFSFLSLNFLFLLIIFLLIIPPILVHLLLLSSANF